MKTLFYALLFVLLFQTSCAVRNVSIYCEPQRAAIYVNGQYQGNGLINYSIPPRQKYIVVSCSEDGVSFVSRKIYTKGLESPISIYMDEYREYSSEPKTLSTY